MSHRCPGYDKSGRCEASVVDERLACTRHWFHIPKSMRDVIWRTYRRQGVGSPEHDEAVLVAMRWLEANPL